MNPKAKGRENTMDKELNYQLYNAELELKEAKRDIEDIRDSIRYWTKRQNAALTIADLAIKLRAAEIKEQEVRKRFYMLKDLAKLSDNDK